ncbi:M23 family metallopeptidase [Microbacterium sp.]|uniref:M23 family metallopeptidase n=1 Tax=Microbacterium sp. TaxID=51671 RepID=UPI0039E62B10
MTFSPRSPGDVAEPVSGMTRAERRRRDAAAAASAPRRGVRGLVQRVTGASLSIGVMGAVALLAIGTTTPGAALSAPRVDIPVVADEAQAEPEADQIQAYVSGSGTTQPDLDRGETYGVVSMSGLAAESGVTIFAGTWVNDPTAPIQWPFPVGVPISAEFGSLDYAAEFATPHGGTDLTPGEGAEVHVIAAGTVRIATEAGGDYGVTVLVDHVVDGQLVSSRYAHMEYGSLQVEEGDVVQAGQVIGRVGSTGKATGPHLHLEVLLDGVTKVDAMAWLRAHIDG